MWKLVLGVLAGLLALAFLYDKLGQGWAQRDSYHEMTGPAKRQHWDILVTPVRAWSRGWSKHAAPSFSLMKRHLTGPLETRRVQLGNDITVERPAPPVVVPAALV